jgi:hypothetical protein
VDVLAGLATKLNPVSTSNFPTGAATPAVRAIRAGIMNVTLRGAAAIQRLD